MYNKKFYTEALLLTRSYYPEELQSWIVWYFEILKIDHVVLFDNDSPIDISSIIRPYEDRIEYYTIHGWPNQHKLYTDYQKDSKAQWTIAIDDDEYLYLSDKYKYSINEFVSYMDTKYQKNMIYPLWLNLLSKESLASHNDLYFNTHTYFSYRAYNKIKMRYSNGNMYGKCFTNNNYSYDYVNRNYGCHHIPKCLDGSDEAIVPDGIATKTDRVYRPGYIPDCFIAHYQFKTRADWIRKCNNHLVISGKCTLSGSKDVYDLLYSYNDLFTQCTLVKDLWCMYNTNHKI